MMEMCALTPTYYRHFRAGLKGYIQSAVNYAEGQETLYSIEERIEQGLAIPVMLTETHKIYNKPTACGLMVMEIDGDAVNITTLSGKLPKTWKDDVWALLSEIAAGQGKEYIQLKGRRGWRRLLKPWGFKPAKDGYLRAKLCQ